MEGKKVIIIGTGIAGLSAGCYLQRNGYNTEIYELHDIPGGLCTAWKVRGYTFDGCLHWLVGSSPSDPFYKAWSEIIDMDKLTFVDHDIFFSYRTKEGKEIHFYVDPDRLQEELLSKAPEDREFIQELIKAVKKLTNLMMPVGKTPELMNWWDRLRTNMKPFPALIYISLGIARTFEIRTNSLNVEIESPIKIDPTNETDILSVNIYNFDPTLAPEGKTCVNVLMETFAYEYWVELRKKDYEKYKYEKNRLAERVIEELERVFGDIKSNVEVIDVATPATFICYTNNWHGVMKAG